MFRYILLSVILLCVLNLNQHGLCQEETLPTAESSDNATTNAGNNQSTDNSDSPESSSDEQPPNLSTNPTNVTEDANDTTSPPTSETAQPTQIIPDTGDPEVETSETTPKPDDSPESNGTDSGSPTTVAVTVDTNNSTEISGTVTELPVTLPTGNNETNFDDQTTFSEGLNNWLFHHMWGRYNLNTMKTSWDIEIPSADNSDGVILMTADTMRPYLKKSFPALQNAMLVIVHYFTCSNVSITETGYKTPQQDVNDLNFKGNLSIANESESQLFKIVNPLANRWIVDSYPIGNVEQNPFTIILEYSSSSRDCIWAIDSIRIWESDTTGTAIPTLPPPNPDPTEETPSSPNVTTQIPTVNTTNSTSTQPPSNTTQNATTATQLPEETTSSIPITTEQNPSTDSSPETTSQPPHYHALQKSTEEMGEIASTMWTAIYVFLVLFCLCLAAFMLFVYRKWSKYRREDSESTPNVSTYNPRASSYQLDKMRENPAYETDAV